VPRGENETESPGRPELFNDCYCLLLSLELLSEV
jgi:hypothetical protein